MLRIDDVVDDLAVRVLSLEGFRLECAKTGAAGLKMASARPYHAYIVDLCLPDIYGLSVVERLLAQGCRGPVVVLTGVYVEPESEALARRLGAADFWFKPIDGEQLAESLRELLQIWKRPSGSLTPSQPHKIDVGPSDHWSTCPTRFGIVAASRPMQAVIEWIDRVGPAGLPVLLTGETGTGKELVARAVHARSSRAGHPFVALNCGAIPENLRESELFGHCGGAFTGALKDQKGLIEQANRGTLFLDEIGDAPLPVQVELLRVLEDGEVRRVGDTRTTRVDVRVIAATNRSLAHAARQGLFREDLYYRLAGALCHLPPLRDRPEDIDALIAYWLPELTSQGTQRVVDVTLEARQVLRGHSWPGNVRELRHVLEAAVCLAAKNQLDQQDVSAVLSGRQSIDSTKSVESAESDETQRILVALEKTHWNRTQAAQLLHVDRKTLWRRLRRLGIGASRP